MVKRSKLDKLQKPSFAGGTITLSAVTHSNYFLKEDHEKFENGTINYLDIPAVANGLNFISSVSIEKINERIKELSQILLEEFTNLTHNNGRSLIKLYGPGTIEHRGGTFLVNFFDADGRLYPSGYIEQAANAALISLRTGCFCNPGIDELNHRVTAEQLKIYFTSRNSGDYFDFVSYSGKMRGAIRISIGIPTTRSDLQKFIAFAKSFLNKKL